MVVFPVLPAEALHCMKPFAHGEGRAQRKVAHSCYGMMPLLRDKRSCLIEVGRVFKGSPAEAYLIRLSTP